MFLPIAPLTLIGLGIVAVPDVVLVIAQGGIMPVLFLIPALLWAARRLRPHHTDLVVHADGIVLRRAHVAHLFAGMNRRLARLEV